MKSKTSSQTVWSYLSVVAVVLISFSIDGMEAFSTRLQSIPNPRDQRFQSKLIPTTTANALHVHSMMEQHFIMFSTRLFTSSPSSSSSSSSSSSTRREVIRKTTTQFTAVQLFTFLSTATTITRPNPAYAERSLTSITESYRRYVPRMETGFTYLANDVKEMIENGNKDTYDQLIKELSAETGTKISAMKGTMRIFATAFSDSVITMFTRELQLATLKTGNEIDNVVVALRASDKDAALESLTKAIYFAQIYAESANAALPRSLDPIKGPNGVGKRLTEQDNSVNGAF